MCLGVPGLIEKVWAQEDTVMARANFIGERRQVCLAYLPDLQVGEYVMAHAGFALTRVEPMQARNTLSVMREYGLLDGVPLTELETDPSLETVPSLETEPARAVPKVPTAASGGGS